MFSATLQPVSRDQIMKLAEGRVGAGERRQIVRRLVAQAARCQVTAGFDPFRAEPVAEASYDLPLRRAFERACRLHERLSLEDPNEAIEAPARVVAGYSPPFHSARRV